jgi:hypothetical protein
MGNVNTSVSSPLRQYGSDFKNVFTSDGKVNFAIMMMMVMMMMMMMIIMDLSKKL